MSWLRRLERRLQPFAIPNLTQFLIAGQVAVFFTSLIKPEMQEAMLLKPSAVWEGEWLRLILFPFIPSFSLIFWIFELMLLHLMGNALEATWGRLRYNLFFFIGYFSAIGFAALLGFFAPDDIVAENMFLYGSIFLAFAYLFPDFEMLLFFILPVKVKWLALLMLIGYAVTFLGGLATFQLGGWLICVMILASNLNLLLFFGRDMVQRLQSRNRRMLRRFQDISRAKTARHTCAVCGATDLTNPERDFRYCTQCEGTPAYCDQHLAGHQHREKVLP